MDESTAKTKWCPHSMTLESYAETTAFNRNTNGQFVGNCIGSECMAWRWWYDPEINYNVEALRGKNPANGFCGLAGKP